MEITENARRLRCERFDAKEERFVIPVAGTRRLKNHDPV
jgi:hypothetical protein